MRDILDTEDINEYDKAIKNRGALMRYMHLVDNYQTRPIFQIEFKDETTTASREDKEVIQTEVIETLPKPLKNKGKLLLKRKVSDLNWNRRGEIKYRGDWIHGSNLTDLVSDALRYKQRDDEAYPQGRNEFKNILKTENVPFRLLGAGSKAGSDQSTAAWGSVPVTPRPILADSAEIIPVKSPVRTRSKISLKLRTPY